MLTQAHTYTHIHIFLSILECLHLALDIFETVQMLEENYSYIKSIVDQQNLGRSEEIKEWVPKSLQGYDVRSLLLAFSYCRFWRQWVIAGCAGCCSRTQLVRLCWWNLWIAPLFLTLVSHFSCCIKSGSPAFTFSFSIPVLRFNQDWAQLWSLKLVPSYHISQVPRQIAKESDAASCSGRLPTAPTSAAWKRSASVAAGHPWWLSWTEQSCMGARHDFCAKCACACKEMTQAWCIMGYGWPSRRLSNSGFCHYITARRGSQVWAATSATPKHRILLTYH